MGKVSFEYWNALADQIIVISSLLGGFSIAVVANFLVSEKNSRLSRAIMKIAVLAACFFLVSVFAMTKLLMMTTQGYPLPVAESDFKISSLIGGLALFLGIVSLVSMLALSGWTKSPKIGRFTTIVSIVTLLFILFMMS